MYKLPVEKLKKALLIILTATGFIIPQTSFAIGGWVGNLIEGVGLFLPFLAARAIGKAVSFGVDLAGKLVNWVLTPDFITYSYTNPSNNPIIKTGLGVTQSLVNMILVLVLIYIALATILKIQEYQAQKLLPIFIIIALLVNFTPVICGLIVDASNIIMNFFVQATHTDRFGELYGKKIDSVISNAKREDITEVTFFEQIQTIAFLMPFMGILILILLIFAAIFTLRYFAIWILVILSPIAFVAYILPVTRRFWNDWWKQFLNWCFVGVTCMFFLYLGMFFMKPDIQKPPSPENMPTGLQSYFIDILPSLAGIAFLGLGLIVGLKTGAMGANTVIAFARSKGLRAEKRIVGWTAKKSAKLAGRTGAAVATKTAKTIGERIAASERIQKTAQRLQTSTRWGEGQTGIAGALKRTVSAPWYRVRRRAGQVLGYAAESSRSKIDSAQKNMEGKSDAQAVETFHKAATLGNKAEQIGIINAMIKSGQINDIMDSSKFGANAINISQITELMKHAAAIGGDADKTMKRAFASVSARVKINKELEDTGLNPEKFKSLHRVDYTKRITDETKDIYNKMKIDDYKNISKTELGEIESIDAMLATAMGEHIKQLITSQGDMAAKAIENRINSGGTVNARLKSYLQTDKGKDLLAINIERENIPVSPRYTGVNLSPFQAIMGEEAKSQAWGKVIAKEEKRKQKYRERIARDVKKKEEEIKKINEQGKKNK